MNIQRKPYTITIGRLTVTIRRSVRAVVRVPSIERVPAGVRLSPVLRIR